MIPITCDTCAARFQVSDDAAGTTIHCPKCGAKNGVPKAEADAAPAKVIAAPSNMGPDGETLLLRVHPAMFRARPALFTLLFLITLGGLAGGGYLLYDAQQTAGIACLVASALGWVPLIIWKIGNMGTSLEITNKRTVSYRGLLGKASTEVRHEDIKNFQVDQTFLNRIFGVGTVGISSSAQHEIEIYIKDVPSPYRIREVIDAHRSLGSPG